MAIYTTESARRHGLADEDIVSAWENVFKYRRARSDKHPPHYIALGTLPDGRTAELVAYSDGLSRIAFHCMTPPTRGFMHECRRAR